MSDSEEDFMSDKFLQASSSQPSSNQPVTYGQRRQKALAALHEKGRTISRKEREHMAREEGLQKNLITETRLAEDQSQSKNKALAMMSKMGFKPGQALGKPQATAADELAADTASSEVDLKRKARVLPIEINMRTGKFMVLHLKAQLMRER
jgi:hypothetical protein